jgi:MOSC domain-containing protein YiiM
MTGSLVSIQVGRPKRRRMEPSETHPEGRPWTSGIYKEPVLGPVWLGPENLDGDKQADRRVHGGPNRAVLAYCAEHYDLWRAELPELALGYGSFGENFAVSGLSEATVCMGDVYDVGEARVQVSQLRGPCFKLELRVGLPGMIGRVLANGRAGWYLRVLQEGYVEAGQAMTLVERQPNARTMLELHARKFPHLFEAG